MITKGEFEKEDITYNRRMEPSDWRYSAAIVGMIRFFKYRNIAYDIKGKYLYYNFEDIYNEENDFSH